MEARVSFSEDGTELTIYAPDREAVVRSRVEALRVIFRLPLSVYEKMVLREKIISSKLPYEDSTIQSTKTVGEAAFRVCSSCGIHGRIYTRNGSTGDFDSKRVAQQALEELAKRGCVNDKEFQKISLQIIDSGLKD